MKPVKVSLEELREALAVRKAANAGQDRRVLISLSIPEAKAIVRLLERNGVIR